MQYTPYEAPTARPWQWIPIAQPVETPVFPHIPMPRLNAIVDVVVAFLLFYGFQVFLGLSGLAFLFLELFPGYGIFGTNVAIGLFALVSVVAFLAIHKQRVSVIGLNRPSPLRFWIATPVGLPLCFMASIVGAMIYMGLFRPDMEEMTTEKMALFDLVSGFPVWLILPFALFVGLHEEVFFRGFFISRLRAVIRSDILVILISGIIFGLVHAYQGWMGVFQTGAIGIVLGALAVYSRTLWPAIIAHAAFDTVSLLIMPLLQGFLEDALHEIGENPNTIVVLARAIETGS